MASRYSTLLSPIQIGGKTLRNRIVKTPAGSRYWSQDGFVTDRVKALFDKISAGGAGMVTVDTMAFMPWKDANFTQGGVYDDKFIPGLKELTDLAHANGSVIIAQMHHGGPADFCDPVGPSELTDEEKPLNDPSPRALSVDEIHDMQEHYFAAVRRLVAAGFDGVEVHAAHGYFMASFLSRVWNKRHDEYGIDTFENRTRVVREIMQGIRANTPEGFLMGVRFNGIEFGNDRALTTDEACEIAKLFEAEGVDYMSITGEGYGKMLSPMLYLPVDYYPYPEPDDFMRPHIKDFEGQGTLIPAAAAIKQVVNVPVVCVGRLDENIAEEVLSQGKADLAGFNRALWADPDMPRKLMEGRPEDIRHCNRCATCEGGGKIATMGPRVCRVNPALGRYDRDPRPAEVRKRVMVIGGGPAGMEAACTAAECGHAVTLYEKGPELGGHLPLASMVKGTYLDNVKQVLDYYKTKLRKLGIQVLLNTEVDFERIKVNAPDAVVIATGGIYECAEIPGASSGPRSGVGRKSIKSCKCPDQTNVNILQKQAELPLRVLGDKKVDAATKLFLPGVGKNVVVVGSGIAGLQGALWLRKRGRNVSVVGTDGAVADQMPPRYKNRLLPYFERNGVTIEPEASDISVVCGKLTYRKGDESGGLAKTGDLAEAGGLAETVSIPCDTIMSLPGMSASLDLFEQLQQAGFEVHLAGSVKGEGHDLIVDAIRDGREVGLAL